MEKNEHLLEFLKISWFGVRICNFESKFSFFFSFATSFFFIFLCFWCFSNVFHCFSWLLLDFRCHGQGKWKQKWKKWKKNENFLGFLKISWFGVRICNFESKFSFFFSFATSFFFIFLCFWWFSNVFHCFSWLLLDFRCHGKGKWKQKWKKWKRMKISSSFWRFPGSEWESATLSPNFHFFFSFATSFFSFSFVFDGFPLFFIVFSWFSWISGAAGKENKKKWSLKWKKWSLK